jgi:hypothetical protein
MAAHGVVFGDEQVGSALSGSALGSDRGWSHLHDPAPRCDVVR